jgi:hypothetical protein
MTRAIRLKHDIGGNEEIEHEAGSCGNLAPKYHFTSLKCLDYYLFKICVIHALPRHAPPRRTAPCIAAPSHALPLQTI